MIYNHKMLSGSFLSNSVSYNSDMTLEESCRLWRAKNKILQLNSGCFKCLMNGNTPLQKKLQIAWVRERNKLWGVKVKLHRGNFVSNWKSKTQLLLQSIHDICNFLYFKLALLTHFWTFGAPLVSRGCRRTLGQVAQLHQGGHCVHKTHMADFLLVAIWALTYNMGVSAHVLVL